MTNAMMNKGACSTKAQRLDQVCGSSATAAECLVPRCDIRIEECKGGCKIYCTCDDEMTCAMLQSMCRAMNCSMCSVQCMRDGEMCCDCRFECCDCTCEMLANGICLCCSTTDKNCLKMIQAMCRCLCCCQDCGCDCTVCINNMPVCCCECCC